MPIAPSHPRLTKAECEFWFEPGAVWQEQTERLMEAHLARAFPDIPDVTEPFLWFEPNYLSVLTESAGAAHLDAKIHAGRIRRALTAYDNAVQPCRVETLFLSYEFELPRAILKDAPKKLVWKTPRELMTVEWESSGGPHVSLHLRCLVTKPPVRCLAGSEGWLERIHHKMDGAFHTLRQGGFKVEGHRE